jgi:hypothetical protein
VVALLSGVVYILALPLWFAASSTGLVCIVAGDLTF